MEIFVISSLINAIVGASLGTAVLLQNSKELANRTFSLLAFIIAFWSFGYWRWLSSIDLEHAFFWILIFTVGSLFIPVCYFFWVTTLVELEKKFKPFIYSFFLVSSILAVLLYTSNLLIRGVEPKFIFPFWPIAGNIYLFYIIFIYVGLVGWSLILLTLSLYRTAESTRKAQIKLVLWGSAIGFGGGGTNFFLWYNIFIPPYINFAVTLGLFFFGYAAIKHHLFNIRVITAELLIFIIWIFLLIQTLLADTLRSEIINGALLALVIGVGILLIRSVINEVKQKEKIQSLAEELASANEELKKLDAAKSEFISIAGHQLRTPLTVIKGYTSMVLEGSFGKIPDSIKEALNRVLISSGALAKLVSDLLDLSRIEAGKIRYEFKEVKLEDIIHGVLQELEETAKVKNIPLIYKNENAADSRMIGDFDKLHEVVINIVDNAIKYSEHGSVELVLRKLGPGNSQRLALSVKDSGIGVKPEDIPKLFGKFVRSENAKRIRPDGMGLGLYIVKRIVEDHKGHVRVESEGVGKGSTFSVELPALS